MKSKAVKTLYLLRHAKAEPGTRGLDDRERILNARGRDACVRMGAYMKEKGYKPALVLSSPSERTRETLRRVFEAAGTEPEERFEDKLYLASAEEILHQVHKVPDAVSSVMVVGHNPGMHHAALTFSRPVRTKLHTVLELKYPTCTLAVLTFGAARWRAIAPGAGELADFATPASLA